MLSVLRSPITMFTLVISAWWIGCVFCQQLPASEPACFSRYDYDHKVMTSLVTLETEHAKMATVVKEQSEEIRNLRKELEDARTKHDEAVKTLQQQMQQSESMTSVKGNGATYIRYGSSKCSENGTELVYNGYVGGSHYTHTGGAVNYLCLPKDPIWGHYKDGLQEGGTLIHGSEYAFYRWSRSEFFGREIINHDVPCAVCRTIRQSVLMVPARNKCYDGWTLEYHGYLSAGYHGHQAASEFACVDINPESLDDGNASSDGKLFYFAEAVCGSLRCPPYVSGRELTCAVCSK